MNITMNLCMKICLISQLKITLGSDLTKHSCSCSNLRIHFFTNQIFEIQVFTKLTMLQLKIHWYTFQDIPNTQSDKLFSLSNFIFRTLNGFEVWPSCLKNWSRSKLQFLQSNHLILSFAHILTLSMACKPKIKLK